MINISLMTSSEKFAELIKKSVLKNFSVIDLTRDFYEISENSEPFILISNAGKKIRGSVKNTLLVLDNAISKDITINPSANSIAVVSSANKFHLDFVKRNSLPAITYGFSNKDTVTISSNNGHSVVLALQREIKSAANIIIEPFDMPIEMVDETSIYNIMSSFCLCILLGNYENYSL